MFNCGNISYMFYLYGLTKLTIKPLKYRRLNLPDSCFKLLDDKTTINT